MNNDNETNTNSSGVENWYEDNRIFEHFNPERTNVWISLEFTKEEAKEWLGIGDFDWKYPHLITWLKGQKITTFQQWKELNDEQIKELDNRWDQYFQINNLNFCDYCYKIIEQNLMFFTSKDKDLYFCSANCQGQWTITKEKWITINPRFSENHRHENEDKTYQQYWEEYGLTLTDAWNFLPLGFTEHEYREVSGWKATNFALAEIKEWLSAGFNKYNYEFATYLKSNNYTPQNAFLDKSPAQIWLDGYYPEEGTCIRENDSDFDENRLEITELFIDYHNLIGSLDCSAFINLEFLYCNNNQLTKLILTNLIKLKGFMCDENQLTQLTLPTDNQLENIYIHDNKLTTFNYPLLNPTTLTDLNLMNNNIEATDLTVFSQFVNLTDLWVGNTDEWIRAGNAGNQFYGSLEALKRVTKLVHLGISNTHINAGVEYLPAWPSPYGKLYYESLPNFRVNEIAKELREFRKDYQAFIKKKIIQNNKAKLLAMQPFEEKEEFLCSRLEEYKPHSLEFLGQGGFASVYRAIWKDSKVAVKKSLYNPRLDPIGVESVRKEIDLLKQLKNKYIIQYYDLYQDEKDLMIIMELAEYGSLDKFIKRNKNNEHDWGLNYNLISQITRGLQYLHSNNIIHRDLKSPNVLITEGYIAKLSDFGLSKVINELGTVKASSMGAIGTPRWWAPEIFTQKKPHSFQTDIYSLGLIIWEIVARELPFKDLDTFEVYNTFYRGEHETIPADCHDDVREIITSCWKKEPNERIKLGEIITKLESKLEAVEIVSEEDSCIEISFSK